MSRWPGRLITKTPVTPGGSSPTASAPGIWTLPEMAYWKKQGLWPDASADAYWGYVSYLMSTSSLSNASNNLFVDSSGAFNPIARNGNATQGTFTPYGTLWSNYFNGSSYITMSSGTAAGTGDFTVEGWFNMPSIGSTRIMYDCRPSGTNGAYQVIYVDLNGYLSLYANSADQIKSTNVVPLNTWNHFALCRSGTSTKLFLNGIQQGSTYTDTNNWLMGASRPIIGTDGVGPGVNNFTGYLSNIRSVNGTALYTANFTPPAATLTAISGTVLLTCQSNRFRDASSYNASVSVSGSVAVTPFSPFVLNAPGAVYNQSDISYWSNYFDGSSYITMASGTAAGTGDFTIEGWFNVASYSTGPGLYDTRPNTTNGAYPAIFVDTSGYLTYYVNTATQIQGATLVGINTWNHFALCRSGTSTRLFLNGVQQGSTYSDTNNYLMGGSRPIIGGNGYIPGGASQLTGYVSNLRVVNGTALYTTAFTPPTSPLTAISGTVLLTCQNAAFTDSSTNKAISTPFGNVTVTGNNPFQTGYYSNYFDGNGDGLSISNYSSSALAFGTGDFTIEFWAFATTTPNNSWTPFFTMGNSGGGQEIRVAQNVNNGGLGWVYPNNTNNGDVYSGYGAMAVGRWNHIAMTRSGSTMRLFLNGAVVATGTGVSFNFTNTTLLRIGLPQPAYSDGAFTGYLSNLRIVKGTAVYTAAFTPPTAPLTAISGTGLLTCQASRLIDSSANAFTLTKVGDTSVVSFDPFYTATPASNGGSMYFDGNGDYLSLAGSPLFSIATSTTPFTVEGWLYPTAAGGVIFNEAYTGSGNTISIAITMSTNANSMDPTGGRYVSFGAYNGSFWTTAAYSSSQIQLNTWTHVACVFTGSTTKIFFNGVDVTAGTPATTWPVTGVSGDGWYVGRRWDTYADVYFSGYISNFRFTNGTAVYTTAFTPPTAPLTPSGNTVLLLNGMNAGVYDAAMQSNAETGGSAQVSSAQVKYGPTAMYFDGNGDYLLTAPNPVFTFGTGDFTVEAWVYLNAVTSTYTKGIVGTYAYAGSADRGWLLGVTSTGITQLFMGGSSGSGFAVNGATTLTTGRWYHLAATRSGTTVRVFVDGVVDGSGTSAYNEDYTGRGLKVGTLEADSLSPSLGNPGTTINGYIDDVRITRGYARYTANFTPPTAALPIY